MVMPKIIQFSEGLQYRIQYIKKCLKLFKFDFSQDRLQILCSVVVALVNAFL